MLGHRINNPHDVVPLLLLRRRGGTHRRDNSFRPQAIALATSMQGSQRKLRELRFTTLGNTAEAKLAAPLRCCAWMRRIASRKTTGGVRTTARAKLKISAREAARYRQNVLSKMKGGSAERVRLCVAFD